LPKTPALKGVFEKFRFQKCFPTKLKRKPGVFKQTFTLKSVLEKFRFGRTISGSVWTGVKRGKYPLCGGTNKGLLSVSLGFLDHVRRADGKKPVTPEVFNSGHLIEAYLNFLSVGCFCAAPFLPSLVLAFDTCTAIPSKAGLPLIFILTRATFELIALENHHSRHDTLVVAHFFLRQPVILRSILKGN